MNNSETTTLTSALKAIASRVTSYLFSNFLLSAIVGALPVFTFLAIIFNYSYLRGFGVSNVSRAVNSMNLGLYDIWHGWTNLVDETAFFAIVLGMLVAFYQFAGIWFVSIFELAKLVVSTLQEKLNFKVKSKRVHQRKKVVKLGNFQAVFAFSILSTLTLFVVYFVFVSVPELNAGIRVKDEHKISVLLVTLAFHAFILGRLMHEREMIQAKTLAIIKTTSVVSTVICFVFIVASLGFNRGAEARVAEDKIVLYSKKMSSSSEAAKNAVVARLLNGRLVFLVSDNKLVFQDFLAEDEVHIPLANTVSSNVALDGVQKFVCSHASSFFELVGCTNRYIKFSYYK
jgi:hypothetical protein